MTRGTTASTLPPKPLERFLALAAALRETRRFGDDWRVLRHSALTLATTPGGATELAAALRATAKRLHERAGWFGPLRSSLRFLVAAMLVRESESADVFSDEVERARALLRDARVARGGTYEILAVLILRLQSDRRHVSATQARRFEAVYRALRADHPFLTGKEDYPACALLCGSTRPPEAIRAGVEALYRELAGRRFAKGDALQTATHVLFLAGDDPARTADRFARVWEAFRESGLRMKQRNYAAVALLATLAAPPRAIVHAVERDRAAIRALRPRPDAELSFALAVGTAFAELARADPRARTAADVHAMLAVQHVVYAQQAAVLAAAAAAASGAAS